MQLIPQSNGEDPLREFNPCHKPSGPGGGQFDRAGRCGADALGWRREIANDLRHDRSAGSISRAQAAEVGRTRRMQRRNALPTLPAFLHPDAEAAIKRDRVVFELGPFSSNSANRGTRKVSFEPGTVWDKAQQLSVLRHELGHVDRRGLGTTMITGFSPRRLHSAIVSAMLQAESEYAPAGAAWQKVDTITEEIRAWRNAIRAGGRVDWATVRWGLGSYFYNALAPGTRSGNALADEFLDSTLSRLKRYARVVQRAESKATGWAVFDAKTRGPADYKTNLTRAKRRARLAFAGAT